MTSEPESDVEPESEAAFELELPLAFEAEAVVSFRDLAPGRVSVSVTLKLLPVVLVRCDAEVMTKY